MERSMNTETCVLEVRNLIDSFGWFGPPQIPIRKNSGMRTISQKTKNRKKSIEMNTPEIENSISRRIEKNWRGRASLFQLKTIDRVVSNGVRNTRGAERPSAPRT